MKNLNEGILDFSKLGSNNTQKVTPNYKIKKINRNLGNLETSAPVEVSNQLLSQENQPEIVSNQIIIPKSIAEIKHQNLVSSIENKSLSELKIQALSKKAKIRENNVNVSVIQNIQNIQEEQHILQLEIPEKQQEFQEPIQLPEIDAEKVNEELIETYEELTNEILPDNIDLVKAVEEIQDIAEFTPGMENLSITDFDFTEIVPIEGWSKHKPSLKSDVGNEEINKITEIVWKSTDNYVKSRKVDLRGIGNLNKKLASIKSDYRLHPINYSFGAPKNSPYSSNKGTTIIISIPLDFNTTKRVLIFMQESRSKYICEINCDIEFIAKVISDYYVVGFNVTQARLKSNSKQNPLSLVINKLALTRKYLIKPLYDGDDEFTQILIETKTGKNQWLRVYIYETSIKGTYQIMFKSKVDNEWKQSLKLASLLDIQKLLLDKFEEQLNNFFNDFDWTQFGVYSEDEDNREVYLINKITYRNLKNAFVNIYDNIVEYPENGIFIKEVLSQLDTKKDINANYGAEIIIGKSNYIDYFILTYSAEQVIGGDKRHGKDYITTEKYYEDNLISEKSRVPYEERYKTVLKKQGTDRNYNSRPYIFTLVYSINNKVKTLQSKSFEELKTLSGFLTINPK